MKNIKLRTAVLCLIILQPFAACSAKESSDSANDGPVTLENVSLDALAFRSIGPAVTGGRVSDIEVNPRDHSEYYVAAGHGSLWKTVNNGVTFTPVFDGQSTFAIGAVTLDPSNPNVVWVGTGENSSHSYVVPGNGVYKSEDGGKSWANKGLDESQQIGEIVVHPENPGIVWVAAYGPHRQSGGEQSEHLRLPDALGEYGGRIAIGDQHGAGDLFGVHRQFPGGPVPRAADQQAIPEHLEEYAPVPGGRLRPRRQPHEQGLDLIPVLRGQVQGQVAAEVMCGESVVPVPLQEHHPQVVVDLRILRVRLQGLEVAV